MNGNHKQNGLSNGNGHSDSHSTAKANGNANANGKAALVSAEEHDLDFRPPTNKTVNYWPAIALATFVWSMTPIAWLMVSFSIYRQLQSSTPFNPFFFWTASTNGYSSFPLNLVWYHSVLEVPFSIYLFYLNRQAQKHLDPPTLDHKLLVALLIQCLEVGTAAHPPRKRNMDDEEELRLDGFQVTDQEAKLAWARFRKWFHYAKRNEILADNVREWLAWAFAGRSLEDCRSDPEKAKLAEKGLALISSRLKHEFPKGYNPDAKPLRLTLDPVPTVSRPIGYYIVCNGVTSLAYSYLKKHGFKLVEDGECEFLVLAPSRKSTRSTELPIVFLHGLGIGLGQYFAFLKHLKNHKDGVIILIQPNISALIWHKRYLNVPSRVEQVRAIKSVMGKNGFDKATILSHSNGTMVHGWLARGAPEICGKHVLTDPVCFRLWEGQTCYSFIARRWRTGIEVLLGYFVAREIGIATTIARRFLWTDMVLWSHDLDTMDPSRLQIIFGENDLLVDVPACLEYLTNSGVPPEAIHVCPKAQHGKSLFIDGDGMSLVRKAVGLPEPEK